MVNAAHLYKMGNSAKLDLKMPDNFKQEQLECVLNENLKVKEDIDAEFTEDTSKYDDDERVHMSGWGQITKKVINKHTGKVERVQRLATTADAMAASHYLSFLEEYFE